MSSPPGSAGLVRRSPTRSGCCACRRWLHAGGDDAPAARRRPRAGAHHPQLDDLAAELSDRLDTRVTIALGQRKGKLTVEFASVDDLDRILDTLGARARGETDSVAAEGDSAEQR